MHFDRHEWERIMARRALGPWSQEHYRHWLRRFTEFRGKPLDAMEKRDVELFWDHLIARGVTEGTLHVAHAALTFAYRSLERLEILRGIAKPRPVSRLPRVPSAEEVAAILGACRTNRDRAMFLLLYGSGLRISELLKLNREDVDFDRAQVFIRQGKNRKDRYTILARAAIPALQAYLKEVRPSGHRLFPSPHRFDRPLCVRALQRVYEQAVKRSGVATGSTIHGLRHAFAVHLAEANTSPFVIMRLLGHSDIATTLLYLRTSRVERMHVTSPGDRLGLAEVDLTPRDQGFFHGWWGIPGETPNETCDPVPKRRK